MAFVSLDASSDSNHRRKGGDDEVGFNGGFKIDEKLDVEVTPHIGGSMWPVQTVFRVSV